MTNHPVPTPPPSEPAPSLRPGEELQALCDAATAGPWSVYDSNEGTWPPRPGWSVANEAFHNPPADEDAPWISVDVYVGTKADAEFIAAARTALPSLLARLRAAEETLAAVGALHQRGPMLDHSEYGCCCGYTDHRWSECLGCGYVLADEGELDRGISARTCPTVTAIREGASR